MFKTWPCNPKARITQRFGEHPENYAKFGLPAHNGWDFALPVGSAVYGVDAGNVIETGFDENGYGNYIKINHEWGETLYAHLSQVLIKQGDTVGNGQRIGLSGNTGNSTGPHLHFGVRVKPYDRTVWGGWTDPAPFFVELLNGGRYRMGAYLAGAEVSSMFNVLRRWQPAVVVMMDLSRDIMLELRRVLPNTKFIYRIYKPDGEVRDKIVNDGPEAAAKWIDSLIRNHPAYGTADYYFVVNEVCQVEWSEWLMLTETMRRWIALAGSAYQCALYTFSVGNPDLPASDRIAFWRVTVPVLEMAILGGHVLLFHAYGAPSLTDPDADWYIYRFEHQNILLRLDAGRTAAQRARVPSLLALNVVAGEYGIDWLIHGERNGWRKQLSAEQYAEQLIAAERHMRRFGYMLGATVFTCGAANPNDWHGYDIWPEVATLLAEDAERMRGAAPASTLRQDLLAAAEGAQVMRLNPNAALQKAIFADEFVPTSPEFDFNSSGGSYVAQRAEHLQSGAVRVYYCPSYQWDQVRYEVR